MLNSGFSPWPSFTEEEAEACKAVLLSNKVNYWTGDECRHFEKEFADYTGTRYAIAVANGTLALDLALKVLDLTSTDEVVVTPRTFLASASSIVTAGARPVFADVDQNTQVMTADTIRAVITPNTRAIIVVHLAGMPSDMDPIMALAEEFDLTVIEDCAQAHGAQYKGKPVGSLGHIGAWSFCQDKIMTTGGEGGMVTLNDEQLWNEMWSYKDHGKSHYSVYEKKHPPGYRWLHDSFGTNWRMTEMQGVLGRIQLKRLNDWRTRRTHNAEMLNRVARQLDPLRVPDISSDYVHAWYKWYAFVKPDRLADGWSRDRIVETIVEAGVPCFQGTCSEIYREAAFDGTGYAPETRLPMAQELGETSISMLVHPTLTSDELEKSCDVLRSVCRAAQK